MASISGLAGFDSASIVDQLMQVEAFSQNRLKTQKTTQESVVTALQKLNTQVASLATAAKTLADPATWQTVKATSSNPLVTVTTGTSAAPANLSVTVDRVAVAHQLGFTDAAALTDVVTSGSTSVRIGRPDGTSLDLPTGDGTLQGLINAVNASTKDTGLTASAVRTGTGDFRLLVSSNATGEASEFTLTNTDGSQLLGGAAVRQGTDAQINLGVGITVQSASNTFADVIPGVSITLASNAVGSESSPTSPTTAEISLKQDSSTVAGKVKSLVDQLNTVLSAFDAQTAVGTDGKSAGALVGDSTVRTARAALLESVFGNGNGNTTMADLGVQTDRYGKVVFKQDVFEQAYAADPAATAARFTSGANDGWAARLQTAAEQTSDTRDGRITAAITGRKDQIGRLSDSIESWDMRLELRRSTLSRQFTALETALSTMNSQSSWLSSQINSLPSYNS